MQRYLEKQVVADLGRKMVFLGGPRQVGKTTLAQRVIPDKKAYLNWDIAAHREMILRGELPPSLEIIFDEIHKYRSWRNYLKGLFDQHGLAVKFLVTGSARLDLYRYGGDSLQGRYHYLRLHPLSVAELEISTDKDFESLLNLGGFPEPFLAGSAVEAKRWSRDYRDRLIREDVSSLERVDDLGKLELLVLSLPERVGSPLSINALREDLGVAHKTASQWLEILERLYTIFRLSPFGAPKLRAVKKEQKHYHFDWSLIPDPAARFENLVASHLLKWVHYQADTLGRDLELRYFRDIDGREVDFVIVEDRKKILTFVECKWSDRPPDKGIKYLKARFPEAEAYQLSATGSKDVVTREGIRLCPALNFLSGLV